MNRTIKIINGLQDFRVTNRVNLEMIMEEGSFIISAKKTAVWEIVLYFIFPIGLWIWWFISKDKSYYGLIALCLFSLAWVYQYLKIAKCENILEFNLMTRLITVKNKNILLSKVRKPKYFSFNQVIEIVKKRKSIGKFNNNYRLYLRKKNKVTALIDVEGDYPSDKILFGLSQIIK